MAGFFYVKLNMCLSCDPTVSLLHICLIELGTYTHNAVSTRTLRAAFSWGGRLVSNLGICEQADMLTNGDVFIEEYTVSACKK